MLLGRNPECATIDALLEAAQRGSSGALVLRGEPGIGKSALLAYAGERAEGMVVLSAVGIEPEAELPFAGLSQLALPVLDRLEDVPPSQRAALESALGIGPPAAVDRFSAYAAVLSLLAAAAEHTPVLALVDDCHWLDRSSADALTFAARRLGDEGVLLLFASWDSESGGFDSRGLPELNVSGLDQGTCTQLVCEHLGDSVSPRVAERIYRETGGNPLAVTELADLLSSAQLRGHEALAQPLPAGPEIQRAMKRRIAALPTQTQQALVVAAASDSETLDELTAALPALGLDVDALEPAEQAGLVTIGPAGLSFRHPVLRSAAYHGASPQDRRTAHAALASGLGSEGSSLARRAWHLAAASTAPDEEVAGELERAGIEARGRAAPAAAASALKAAADLTPNAEQRARRLREAAQDAHLTGDLEGARGLLDQGLHLTEEPALRAEIMHARARVEMLGGSPKTSRDSLLAGAEIVEKSNPAQAALMLSDASLTAAMAGEGTDASALAQRAYALGVQVGGPVELICGFALGNTLVFQGERRAGHALMLKAEPLMEQMPPAESLHFGAWFGHCCCIAGDEETGARLLRRLVVQARSRSAVGALPLALAFLCNAEFRLGNWVEAYADGVESVRLAQDINQTNELTNSLVWLAQVEAARGQEDACRSHISWALELVEINGAESMRHLGAAALGLLELGIGHPGEAVAQLEFAESFAAARGLEEPAVAGAAPNLVEAYLRAGRHEEARSAFVVLEQQATKTEGRWALATAARCGGLLANEEDFETRFRDALDLHADGSYPFERARTELAFGDRLRRERRRSEARPWLRKALSTFAGLGASPWEQMAAKELAATGERTRRRTESATDQLTAQELQVALIVADGATNREAAAALFVSPKTVETHLGHAYRKLGIRSRTELARHLRGPPLSADGADTASGHLLNQ